MGLKVIIPVLLGWLLMKYALLSNASFETSFQCGILYHTTALISLAVASTWNGIKSFPSTPDFIDGFKHVAKDVISYAVGATVLIGVWHHGLMKESTQERLDDLKTGISTHYSSEEDFQTYLSDEGLPSDVVLTDWVEQSIEQVELLYAPSVQFSLSLMVYLVLGLFISLIASFLWTKVWFTQQSGN
jgi:hypothetical protein